MCLSQITHFYFKICYSSAIIFSVRNQRTKENEIQKITGAKYRRGHSQVTRDDRIKGRKITQLSDKREEVELQEIKELRYIRRKRTRSGVKRLRVSVLAFSVKGR